MCRAVYTHSPRGVRYKYIYIYRSVVGWATDRPIHPHYVVGIDGIFATSIVATPSRAKERGRASLERMHSDHSSAALGSQWLTKKEPVGGVLSPGIPADSPPLATPAVIRSLPFSRRGKRTSPCPPLLRPELVTLAATCLREGGDGRGMLATTGMLGLYRLCVPLIFHSLELHPVSQLPPPAGNAFMLMRKSAFAANGQGGGI